MPSFITELAVSLENAFSTPGQALLHGSFLILIVSMAMRNITVLRLLAITSGLSAISYRWFIAYDPATLLWQVLLVLVNATQLAILWSEKLRARLSDDAEFFIAKVLSTVHRTKARRFVKLGRIVDAPAGTLVMKRGGAVRELIYLLDGTARIERDRVEIARLGRGEFSGEMSFVTGGPASADVIADTPLRYFSFEHEKLRPLLQANADLRNALEASFNRNLVAKLVGANERHAAAGAVVGV